jgi:hypothetical protein
MRPTEVPFAVRNPKYSRNDGWPRVVEMMPLVIEAETVPTIRVAMTSTFSRLAFSLATIAPLAGIVSIIDGDLAENKRS